MTTLRRSFLVFSLVVLAVASGRSQQPPAEEPTFEGQLEVTEALVDVLVTDRDGNVILGLGPGDFQIRESGRPVEVIASTFYSNRRFLDAAGAEQLGIDPAAVPDQRLFVLVFHDQSQGATDAPGLLARQLRAGRDAAAWLRSRLTPGDLVAVAGYGTSLALHQDFTADRAALERAIDRAVRNVPPPQQWPSRAAAESDLPALTATLPASAELREKSATIEAALSTLAAAAEPLTGRKNLILFSSGFGQIRGDGQYIPSDHLYRPMIEALNGANVAVYAVDLAAPGVDHPYEDALSRLAADTGGRPYFDLQNFDQPLETVAETTNGYYLVAFRSAHPAGEAGYAPIDVGLANPEFRVTARQGYRYGAEP